MVHRLSKRTLDRRISTADPAADVLVYDASVPGFAIRLRGGRAVFVYRYKHRGRIRRVTIGAYGAMTREQARDIARELYGQVRKGSDPAEAKRAQRVRQTTMRELSELHLDDLRARAENGLRRGKRSTLAEWRRLLERSVLPYLGHVEAAELGLDAIEKMHRALARTPAQANRALTVVSAILGYAERKRIRPLGSNPCKLVVRFVENESNRRLSLAELERLGEAMRVAAAEGENESALRALRLVALTGLRRSEVVGHGHKPRRTEGSGLRWRDVDFDGRCLRLRDAKAGPRTVPLGGPPLELLRDGRRNAEDGEGFVCPGEVAGQPLVGIDKVRRRLFERAGLSGATLHSLRHTFSSVAADAGLGEYIVAGLLGHRSGNTTERYVHPDRDPLIQAADLVSRTIAAALDGKPAATVVRLDAR